MRAAFSIARTSLTRFLRDRSSAFFVFVLPLLIILMIGLQFSGASSSKVALVGGDTIIGRAVTPDLRHADIAVRTVTDRATALRRVEDGTVDAAIVIPDIDPMAARTPADAAAAPGPTVEFVARGRGTDARVVLSGALERASIDWRAATMVGSARGSAAAAALDAVTAADRAAAPVRVKTVVEGTSQFEGVTRYNLGAASQLVLFTFLSSLASAGALILTRRLGVARRMLASPTPVRSIVAGETLGKFAICVFQALYILVVTAVVFRVSWGPLPLTALVIVVFALLATGLGMLLGSMLDNEGAASGIGVMLALCLGALGGAMAPSELFPDSVRRISKLTPHYWALDALKSLMYRHGGLADIAKPLGILAAEAVVVLALAAWAYRRSIVRA